MCLKTDYGSIKLQKVIYDVIFYGVIKIMSQKIVNKMTSQNFSIYKPLPKLSLVALLNVNMNHRKSFDRLRFIYVFDRTIFRKLKAKTKTNISLYLHLKAKLLKVAN